MHWMIAVLASFSLVSAKPSGFSKAKIHTRKQAVYRIHNQQLLNGPVFGPFRPGPQFGLLPGMQLPQAPRYIYDPTGRIVGVIPANLPPYLAKMNAGIPAAGLGGKFNVLGYGNGPRPVQTAALNLPSLGSSGGGFPNFGGMGGAGSGYSDNNYFGSPYGAGNYNSNLPGVPNNQGNPFSVPVIEPTTVGPVQQVCLGRIQSLLTHYNSDPSSYQSAREAEMEGGSKTRFGEPLNSVEEAIQNGRPISLAADIYGEFGARCNQKDRRCTVLVYSRGFDQLYPEYSRKFPGLPEDSFIGIIEDTGGAFYNKGTSKLDLAVRNRSIANGRSDGNMRFALLNNPCGSDRTSRQCNVSGLKVMDTCQVARNRTHQPSAVASTGEDPSSGMR